MTLPVIVCRPEPGATATATRARTLGLRTIVAPLFEVEPFAWEPPEPARFDAMMMTSANAARHGGPALGRYRHLPLYAVGSATAAYARDAEFGEVIAGGSDVDALTERIAAGPHRRVLHLCGRDVRPAKSNAIEIVRVPVYASHAIVALPASVIDAGPAVALLHSPRAAATFRGLVEAAGVPFEHLILVAISPAVEAAAGGGWRGIQIAAKPTDRAMLAIARILCDNRRR